jgi:DNA-directed RNA polymerase specialized sigma24 family protein
MEVTKETIKIFGIKKEDLVPAKIGNKIVSAIMIPATKDQYEAYMQPLWAEMKREERSRRCMVSDGRGKIKRCENYCKNCEKMKEGATLSLEAFFEENELEFEDASANQCETILTAMLFEDLLDKLSQLAPELTPIFEMLYDGKSQYAIAELIGKPQTTVNYMIKRMRMILQQKVNREDLSR